MIQPRPDGIDAILPLGKPGRPYGTGCRELTLVHDRRLIAWALDEALHAGANRIVLVAPEGHPQADEVAAHLRSLLKEHCIASGRVTHLVQLAAKADGPEGWDGVIRVAAAACRGQQALLIDPTMLLTKTGLVTSFAAFMLRQAAIVDVAVPRLATAELPWDEALSFAILTAEGRAAPAFHPPGTETDIVFAGRALLPLPLPAARAGDVSDLFPYELLTRLLLEAGALPVRLLLQPLDQRFTRSGPDVPEEPAPPGLPVFVSRLGLGALHRIA